MEGDSKTTIGWGLGMDEGSWQLASLIYEIRELVFEVGDLFCASPKGSKLFGL